MGIGTRWSAALRQRIRGGLVKAGWFGVFHPRTTMALVLLVTALAGYWTSKLELSTDFEDLLPKNVRSAQLIKSLVRRYGAAEPVVLAISGEGEADLEDRVDLALALRDRLAQSPRLKPVSGMFGEDPWALLETRLAEGLLLYLDPAEIDQLGGQLTREAIDRRVELNRVRLSSPLGPLTARLIAEDPLGFSGLALKHLGALKGRLTLGSREGVLVTGDGAFVLLMVRPEGPNSDVDFAREIVGEIVAATREVFAAQGVEGTVAIGPPPEGTTSKAVHVGMTGALPTLVNYREMLGRDAGMISIVSYFAQLALFLFAFRRLGALLVAGTSMLFGAIWALGFTYLTIGQINVFTAGSIGILCGLTIDFSVHIYNRYLEEVHAGRDMARAFAVSHGETGPGILASVGVMVWTFIAGGFSEFRGLRHLGVICGAGLVLSLVACLVMIPALTALTVRLRKKRDLPGGLATFGLTPVLNWVTRHPLWTVGLSLVIGGAMLSPAIRVRLDEDVTRLKPKTAPSTRLQNALMERAGASLQPVLALVSGATDEEVLERAARIEKTFDQESRREDGRLAFVLGPSRVLPPPSRQRQALERLAALRAEGTIDPERTARDLLGSLERHGFRIDERARHAVDRVRAILARDHQLTKADLAGGAMALVYSDLVVAGEGGQRLGIVSAYPRPNLSSNVIVDVLRKAVAESQVPAELTGARVLSQEVRPLILKDGIVASVLAALGIVLILLISFRRLVLALLTLVPLLVGMVVSIGAMVLLNVDFNLVTVATLPLVLGISIDNGIHVVHRYTEGVDADVAEVLRHTGRGVVMASLTTIVGFGALLFADYPGLVSSGVLAMLGCGATMVAALTLLPALLMLLPRKGVSKG